MLDLKAWIAKVTDNFVPKEVAYSITKTGGNSTLDTDQTVFVKSGNVVSFFIRVVTNGTTAAGGDIFVGTLNTPSLIPKCTCGGTGFYGGNSRVCAINTAGEIRIRNTGASIGANIGNTVYGTYIVGGVVRRLLKALQSLTFRKVVVAC